MGCHEEAQQRYSDALGSLGDKNTKDTINETLTAEEKSLGGRRMTTGIS
jgi:hypothetical protein